MARRRGGDKPVERLRSSWTSDADLEETLASMFHCDTVPGDKLAADEPVAPPANSAPDALPTAGTPDSLSPLHEDSLSSAPPDILSAAPPDNQSAVAPDTLSGPMYRTLEGAVVDGKCIRPFDAVQQGHTLSEHQVYIAMWRLLGSASSGADSREGLLPMRLIAAKVSLSVRNLRRVLHSLIDKFAVDVTEYEDKTKSIPRRYRVWSPKMVVDRRRHAGYTHIYRNRNLITLARPHVNLSPDHRTD